MAQRDQSMKNTNLTERSSGTEAIGGVPNQPVKTEVEPQPNIPEVIQIDTNPNPPTAPANTQGVKEFPPEQIKNPE